MHVLSSDFNLLKQCLKSKELWHKLSDEEKAYCYKAKAKMKASKKLQEEVSLHDLVNDKCLYSNDLCSIGFLQAKYYFSNDVKAQAVMLSVVHHHQVKQRPPLILSSTNSELLPVMISIPEGIYLRLRALISFHVLN